jgi:hypothetical protein
MAASSSAQNYLGKQYINLFSVTLSRLLETDSCLLPKPLYQNTSNYLETTECSRYSSQTIGRITSWKLPPKTFHRTQQIMN